MVASLKILLVVLQKKGGQMIYFQIAELLLLVELVPLGEVTRYR